MIKKLTLKQERFCEAYVRLGTEHGNAAAAYREAYDAKNMKPITIHAQCGKLLRHPLVAIRVRELRSAAAEKAEISIADVLRTWVQIATADPNEIIQNRRTCCRFCHGINHARQWVETEYAAVSAKAYDAEKKIPDAPGGFGYNATHDPHPDCPVCFGEGVENVFVADTRKLTGKAKALYGGLRKTRSGVEIILRNQDAALENIAKFLGMFKDKQEQNNVPLVAVSTVTNDPIEAAKIYQSIMKGN